MKRILISLFTITLLFFTNEKPAQALIAACYDLTGIDFGDCEAILGYALLDGECQLISGCGTVDSSGYDFSYHIYEDFQVCYMNCGIDYSSCVDSTILTFDFDCDEPYSPVCGCNGVTYSNYCTAFYEGGVISATFGECTVNDCTTFPSSTEELGWVDDLDMTNHQLTLQYYNGEVVYYYEVCSPFLSDGLNILFDCNGNEICKSGGFIGYNFEECPDFVPSNDVLIVPCSSPGCTFENPLVELPFIDSLITALSDDPDCYCNSSLEMGDYGGVITFLLNSDCNFIDQPDVMYDCEGNIICLQNGETGPPYCSNIAFTPFETLWVCEGNNPPIDMMDMDLSLKVFLEGPMNASGTMNPMNPDILMEGHPYGGPPYYYDGPLLTGMVPETAVDYILIELREDFGMEAAAQQVAFVLSNGDIVLEDGTFPDFLIDASKTYQVWLRHHNHLDIVSTTEIIPDAMVVQNFLNLNDAMGPQQLKEVNGVYAMYSGDINGDGTISVTDYDAWALSPAAIGQYLEADTNLDGVVQATDYDIWFENKAKIGFAQNQN